MSTGDSATGFRPKKSVALSGTEAGNTALCTVGHSGNDLHYRGYDIRDLAAQCEFEEVAHLLVHGALPTAAEHCGLQDAAALAARVARCGKEVARAVAGDSASDGCAADRCFCAGMHAAGERRS